MTILVTYKTGDKIYMGCDTQVTGGTVSYCKDKWCKVMINDDDYIWVGCTGYAKFGDFFEHGFKAPYFYKKDNFVDYLHNKLAPAITTTLTKRKITKEKEGNLQTESEFLIVYDSVYALNEDTAPVEEIEPFVATGSGYPFAYGAYHAYTGEHIMDNDENIKKMLYECLEASIRYDPYCSGEQIIHVMERAK